MVLEGRPLSSKEPQLLAMCRTQFGTAGPEPLDRAYWTEQIARRNGRRARARIRGQILSALRHMRSSRRFARLSGFLIWRIFFVPALFVLGALAIFYALERGLGVRTAHPGRERRGVFEIFFLLVALAVVVLAQLLFTYAPVMQDLFHTRPVPIWDGFVIVAAGVVLMFILEGEKGVVHWRKRCRRAGAA